MASKEPSKKDAENIDLRRNKIYSDWKIKLRNKENSILNNKFNLLSRVFFISLPKYYSFNYFIMQCSLIFINKTSFF